MIRPHFSRKAASSTKRRARHLGVILALAGVFFATGCANQNGAESFPSKPINLIVPFSPGGSADGTTRQLATTAAETCGTDIIVRNETGGSGAVGFQSVASAAPDGYTVGTASIELSILSHLGVSPISPDDVRGVMQYSEQPIAYAVPPNSDIQSIDDVINTDTDLTVASSGTGSIYHIGFEGMAQEAGISDKLRNVPFDGSASAIQAALGEQTDMVAVGAAEMAPYVESGQLRALAVAAETRADDIMPDVPTLDEVGIDWTSNAILGLFLPAGTPDDVTQKLNDCFNQARQNPGFAEYMDNLGFTQEHKGVADFDEFLNEEFDRYDEVVDNAGIGGQK